MPTTSIASAVSRHTMNRALPMMSYLAALLGDDAAAPGRFVEFVEVLVLAGLQRVDVDRRLGAGRNDLFLLQVLALELDRLGVLVVDFDAEALAGRHFQHRRLESS